MKRVRSSPGVSRCVRPTGRFREGWFLSNRNPSRRNPVRKAGQKTVPHLTAAGRRVGVSTPRHIGNQLRPYVIGSLPEMFIRST